MNHRDKFEDDVSAITDRVWSQINRQAMSGTTSPIEVLGVKVNGFMTRDQVRYRIHEAAYKSDFKDIEAAK